MAPMPMPPFEELIKTLKHFRLRKGMYVGVPMIESVSGFLQGFVFFSHVFGLSGLSYAVGQGCKQRGWNQWPAEPNSIEQMRRKGMSDEEIMNEMIDFTIQAVRQLAEQSAIELRSGDPV